MTFSVWICSVLLIGKSLSTVSVAGSGSSSTKGPSTTSHSLLGQNGPIPVAFSNGVPHLLCHKCGTPLVNATEWSYTCSVY